MQMMHIDQHTICAPETPILGLTLATIDPEWIAIGLISGDHSLLLDRDEWPAFVEFIHDIDQVVQKVYPHAQ
jgi:hypothetical protein